MYLARTAYRPDRLCRATINIRFRLTGGRQQQYRRRLVHRRHPRGRVILARSPDSGRPHLTRPFLAGSMAQGLGVPFLLSACRSCPTGSRKGSPCRARDFCSSSSVLPPPEKHLDETGPGPLWRSRSVGDDDHARHARRRTARARALVVTHQKFKHLIDSNALVEYQNVHLDDYYGTPRQAVEDAIASRDLIADIEFSAPAKSTKPIPTTSC